MLLLLSHPISGTLEVAIIRMATLYDLHSDTILYGGMYIPATLFSSDDPMEQKFIQDVFAFVRELSSFCLTETEIGLYSALVLMSPSKRCVCYEY